MKTSVPYKVFILFPALVITFVVNGQLLTNASLSFQNSSLLSGIDGQNGAVYLFPLVNNDLDAHVTIVGRSSAQVFITNIDVPAQGHQTAFQPQIRYSNGDIPYALNYWMEFQINFYNKGTSVPATINTYNVTGLDIDGNSDRLREYNTFYTANNYILEELDSNFTY